MKIIARIYIAVHIQNRSALGSRWKGVIKIRPLDDDDDDKNENTDSNNNDNDKNDNNNIHSNTGTFTDISA